MSKPSRTLARRKAQSDNKARINQHSDRRGNVNAKAPVQPMETKKFSAAENKALGQKMQKYQEAANVVNEFLDFLKQQHGIGDNEGWQLGEGCFVRPAKAAEGTPAPAKPAAKGKKGKSAVADPPPTAQGENAATVAKNGQLEPEPTL